MSQIHRGAGPTTGAGCYKSDPRIIQVGVTDHSSKRSRLQQPGLLCGARTSAGAGSSMGPAPEPDPIVMEGSRIRIQKKSDP